jgi:hypothetical protein
MNSILHPHSPVERPVADCFGDVLGIDHVGAFEIGDCTRDAQDLIVGAGGQAPFFMTTLRRLMASSFSTHSFLSWRGHPVVNQRAFVAEPLGLPLAGGKDLGTKLRMVTPELRTRTKLRTWHWNYV